ncbi:MAG: ABC transporter ATP-binding protein [Chloroflexota bacterium]
MALIEVQEVSKRYATAAGEVAALSGASFAVADGELVAVMGPSGSGKSTLLSILGGLNPPSDGRLVVDGVDVYSLGSERRADFRHEYIGFVFQQLQLLPYLTALENVALPLAISRLPVAERRERARSALARVGLVGKEERLPGALSGGEQGRVAVARAIVNDPPLILADEPTGSLDSRTGAQVMRLLRELADDGLAVVVVTHNLDNADYADRLVQLHDGRIVAAAARSPHREAVTT